MALVARNTWMRCRGAGASARAASSMSSKLQRARPQMRGPGTSRATASTLSKSPREAAGKPASMTSTDRKSTRLNSSHTVISYAVFCLKKKKKNRKNDDGIEISGELYLHDAAEHGRQ